MCLQFFLSSPKGSVIYRKVKSPLIRISSNSFLTNLEPTKDFSFLHQILKLGPSPSQTKQIHAQVIVRSLGESNNLVGGLIRSYSDRQNLRYARRVFDSYPYVPPTFLWNLIIQAYSKTPFYEEALYLFREMLLHGGGWHFLASPDDYTFTFIITACSRLRTLMGFGENCHAMVYKAGYDADVCVGNSLLSMYAMQSRMVCAQRVFDGMPLTDTVTWTSLVKGYAACGQISEAEELFIKMPKKNDVSWAVMIAGFVGQKMYNDALRCFNNMLTGGNANPNEAVLVSVLSACAHLGALDQGKWIHIYIDKKGVSKSSNLATALIDMYAKCGKIDCAKQVFKETYRRDLLTWTSLISGLSMHGLGKEALGIFYQMLACGLKPDNVTLVGVLNACSHSGEVEEGLSVFYDMERLWGITPKLEHYGCLVDLLSRAGCLEDAFRAVKSMSIEPDAVIWRALLSACRVHGNAGLGEKIIKHVAQTDSNGGGYTLLSNLYASLGQWDNVSKVRESSSNENDSSPGCSYIEIEGVIHEFLAADKLHPQIVEINTKLNKVMKRISLEGGYIPMTKHVLFDLSDEEKKQAISWHSEKLAVAFALMSTSESTPIRVMKNLRICEDCHSAMKAISNVFSREIIVRDCSRFHTFKDGHCSCNDYW